MNTPVHVVAQFFIPFSDTSVMLWVLAALRALSALVASALSLASRQGRVALRGPLPRLAAVQIVLASFPRPGPPQFKPNTGLKYTLHRWSRTAENVCASESERAPVTVTGAFMMASS
jgi:hypothetical protein